MSKESYETVIRYIIARSTVEWECTRWIAVEFINKLLCESAHYYSYLC